MLVLVLTVGKALLWVAAVITASVTVWKYAVKPVQKGLKRLEMIGDNGKETVFDLLHQLADTQAMQGSLKDVIDVPVFTATEHGEIDSVNPTLRRLTGWGLDDLTHGRWREKLDHEARVFWDEAVEDKTVFDRSCHLLTRGGRKRVTVTTVPVFSRGRHIGFRGSIDRLGDGLDD